MAQMIFCAFQTTKLEKQYSTVCRGKRVNKKRHLRERGKGSAKNCQGSIPESKVRFPALSSLSIVTLPLWTTPISSVQSPSWRIALSELPSLLLKNISDDFISSSDIYWKSKEFFIIKRSISACLQIFGGYNNMVKNNCFI